MRVKADFKWIILVVLILPAVFFAWSCGGGGGDAGGGGGEPLTPAILDQSTAEVATVIATSSGDIGDLSDQYIDDIYRGAAGPDTPQSMALGGWVLKRVQDAFIAGDVVNEEEMVRAGSGSESGACEISGTYSISGRWTGPDEPDDICQVSDATVTIAVSNCVEYGETTNGSIVVSISGNLCQPTAMSVSFSNFTYDDGGLHIESADFDMAMTNLQWSGDDPSSLRLTLDGDIAVDDLSMAFSQYTMDVSNNGSVETATVNGSLSGGCIDGWVTLTTISSIHRNVYDDCPYEGSIQIAGAQDVTFIVEFNSDGSVDIGDQHYDSCNDPALPDQCR